MTERLPYRQWLPDAMTAKRSQLKNGAVCGPTYHHPVVAIVYAMIEYYLVYGSAIIIIIIPSLLHATPRRAFCSRASGFPHFELLCLPPRA